MNIIKSNLPFIVVELNTALTHLAFQLAIEKVVVVGGGGGGGGSGGAVNGVHDVAGICRVVPQTGDRLKINIFSSYSF